MCVVLPVSTGVFSSRCVGLKFNIVFGLKCDGDDDDDDGDDDGGVCVCVCLCVFVCDITYKGLEMDKNLKSGLKFAWKSLHKLV